MRFISLNWKLAAGFTALTFVLVVLYTLITQRTFEADKAAYMGETQRVQAQILAQRLDAQIARVIADGKRIAAGEYEVFRDHPEILAFEARFENGQFVTRPLEKFENGVAAAANLNPLPGQPEFKSLDEDRIALAVFDTRENKNSQILRIVFRIPNALGESLRGQMMALSANGNILVHAATPPELDPALKSVAAKMASDRSGSIKVEKLAGVPYLVHAANLNFGGLQILSLLPEQEAMAAPSGLFRRSVLYLMLCFGVISVATLLLSNRWSQIILLPAPAAGDAIVNRMIDESSARALLEHKRENSAVVQQNLMPETAAYLNGHVRLAGTHFAADECGGDWWYYYQRDSDLYVIIADSTAHGLPAALMTAAARSAFSFIKDSETDLKQIARRLDRAIHECSNGVTRMPAFLIKLNVELGEGRFINAGFDPAVLVRKDSDVLRTELLNGRENPAFGILRAVWSENLIQLEAGDRLFLCTDGLLQAHGEGSKEERQNNLRRYLEANAYAGLPPDLLNNKMARDFTERTAAKGLSDDATFAIIDFRNGSSLNQKLQ